VAVAAAARKKTAFESLGVERDLFAHTPKKELVEERAEALREGRLKGLWKRKIRAAGGELVEIERPASCRGVMTLGVLTHPESVKFVERIGTNTTGGMALAMALGVALGTDRVSDRGLIERSIAGLWWEESEYRRRSHLQLMMAERGVGLLGGEDRLEVWSKKRETKGQVDLTKPRFVVVTPNRFKAEEWKRVVAGYGPRMEKGTEDQGVCLRWSFDMIQEHMRFKVGGGMGTYWAWPSEGAGAPPEIICSPMSVFSGECGTRTIAGMVGVPGSGLVAVAFNLGCYRARVKLREGASAGRAMLVKAPWFHASLMEILLEWAEKEKIDWDGMDEATRGSLCRALRWRDVEKKKTERVEEEKPVIGGLAKMDARVRAFVVDTSRKAILESSRLRREAGQWEGRMKWKEAPTGETLSTELKGLVEKGVLRSAYTLNEGQTVVVLLPAIRYVQTGTWVYREKVYPPGVYELEDLWLWVPANPVETSILALDSKGNKHPHPHVYADREGQICWGRTDGTGEGADAERSYGDVAIETLFTKGWGSFVETMTGFFSQWHDDGSYVSPIVYSTKIGELEDRP